MGHKWISTDSGDQCYQCGIVLDYGARTEDGGVIDWTDPSTETDETAAHNLVGLCGGPTEAERAHHYVLAVQGFRYVLDCAYGDAIIGQDGGPDSPQCIGA